MLGRYFTRQIQEIQADPALRFYGACLAACQVLSFFKWFRQRASLSNQGEAICWPFFEDCFRYRVFGPDDVTRLLLAFGAAAAVGVLLFLIRRRDGLAYWWLVGLTVFRTLIYAQDYRLRMNQHYMLYIVTLAFLFLPNKRVLLRYVLVSFYVWASFLKYNVEWLSGAALHTNPLWVPDALIPAACAYVVVLESFIVWGMLSGRRWVYWAALFQVFWFHVVSWPTVGFFYPLLMFALLAIFPLTRLIPAPGAEPKSLLRALFTGTQPRSTYAFLGFWTLMQLVPVAMPGDEKITGEGRLFSLHMFDAWVHCEGAITLRFTDGAEEALPIPLKQRPIRIMCDPAVNFSRARRACFEHRDDARFVDLDLIYRARRSHQKELRLLVGVKDFCRQDLSYDLWRPNAWILKE